MEIIDWQIMNNGLNGKIDKGIVLYGASGTGERIAMLLHNLKLNNKVLAVLDSDKKKWGSKWFGYNISNPEIIKTIPENAIIVITSVYLDEIFEYLNSKLECTQKICSGFSLKHAIHYDIINNRADYVKKENSEIYKKIYSLWKENNIPVAINSQQKYFYDMVQCIMENPKSILLCGMPKTGNISLSTSFEEETKQNVIFTYHASYYNIHTLKTLRESLKFSGENEIKIISGIRLPIERIISHKWQDIKFTYLFNDSCISPLIDYNYDYYINDLLLYEKFNQNNFNCRDYRYNDSFYWFNDHILKAFGIDIFKYPFDKEKGYSIIVNKNISIFVYRLDKLDELENEIREFSGDNNFKLKRANVASEKRYAFAYREYMQNVKVNTDFFDNLVKSKGMTHFYTEEECKNYRKKWESKLV